MGFDNPWALAGLLMALLIWRWMGVRWTPGSLPRTGAPVSLQLKFLAGLRTIMVVVAVLALAGMSLQWPTRNRRIIMLFDVSESIAGHQVDQSRKAAIGLLDKLRPDDTVGILAFAGSTRLISRMTSPDEAKALLESSDLTTDQTGATNLHAALRAAAELFKEPRGNRSIILFSDGRITSGIEDSGALKEAANTPVFAVPIGVPNVDLTTMDLALPEGLRAGETGAVHWTAWSITQRQVDVRLKTGDKMLVGRRIELQNGMGRYSLAMPPMAPGVYPIAFEVVDPLTGRNLPSAASGGVLAVDGHAKVLVVSDPRNPSLLTRVLRIQEFSIVEESPEHLPEMPGGLSPYAAVVFDNISARRLTERQIAELQDYVISGGGFLVVGGDTSLGRGEYFQTTLEEILPVHTDTRQRLRFSRSSILFVIDTSGSMSEPINGIPKQLAAMKGILAAVDELNPKDEVGILAFSDAPSWVLPFTPVAERETIEKAIGNMERGGGTDMAAALEEATRGFSGRGPFRRHVVLISDGIADTADLKKFSEQLKAMGATITTIGVGDEVNEPLLKSVAQWGEGGYYRAEFEEIPQVLVKETAKLTRVLVQEGNFQPKFTGDEAAVMGLDYLPPPIKGYLVTKPKAMASVPMTVGNGDPLFASWRYGSGRVAVFASDSGRRWLSSWLTEPIYNQFWGNVVRSIQRNQPDEGLRLEAKAEGDFGRIIVEATNTDGRLRQGLTLIGRLRDGSGKSFYLEEKLPGRYEAKVALAGKGYHLFEVRGLPAGNWKSGGIWVPASQELMTTGPDMVSLLGLVTDDGIMTMETLRPPPPAWAWERIPLRAHLLMAVVLIFLFELGLRSLTLGQMKGIREAINEWRKKVVQQMEAVRRHREQERFVSNRNDDSAARRYLAERMKRRSREQEDRMEQ